MPHYEVTVTATRTICVKAENEEDATERACGEYLGEWNEVTAEVEDEFDDAKDAEFIKQYKDQGELLTVRYLNKPSVNTAKTTDPIWDSRNSEEPK